MIDFQFWWKGCFIRNISPSDYESWYLTHKWGISICIWGLGGSDAQLLCGVMVGPKVTGVNQLHLCYSRDRSLLIYPYLANVELVKLFISPKCFRNSLLSILWGGRQIKYIWAVTGFPMHILLLRNTILGIIWVLSSQLDFCLHLFRQL